MAIEHTDIVDSELHELKGASSASAGQVPVADGAGSHAWGNIMENSLITYGALYTIDTDAVTIATIGTTVKLFAGFANNGLSNNTTPDHTADTITVSTAGDYKIEFTVSFSSVAVGDAGDYKFAVRNNAVATHIEFTRTMSGSGDLGVAACSGFVTLAVNDVLSLYVESDDSGDTDDISVVSASLTALLMKAA